MKQYTLLQDYRGIPKDTVLYGRYPVTGGGDAYFTKENIPQTEEGGTEGLFASFVENSPLFKEVTQ